MKSLSPTKLLIISYLFKLFPFGKFHNLRCCFLRWAGATVGKNVEIMPSVQILGNFNLLIGDNCFIGHNALIMGSCGSTIELENYAVLSSRTTLCTGDHIYRATGNRVAQEGIFGNIKLEKGCCVGLGSTVLPGKTIGAMAHVAAGSVITKDVPPYHRVAGVPARMIRDLRE